MCGTVAQLQESFFACMPRPLTELLRSFYSSKKGKHNTRSSWLGRSLHDANEMLLPLQTSPRNHVSLHSSMYQSLKSILGNRYTSFLNLNAPHAIALKPTPRYDFSSCKQWLLEYLLGTTALFSCLPRRSVHCIPGHGERTPLQAPPEVYMATQRCPAKPDWHRGFSNARATCQPPCLITDRAD
jgi:hypothetical protein